MKDPTRRVSILIIAHSTSDPMVVDLTLVVNLQVVHVGRHQDVVEGLHQVEQQPDVNHLDVGRLGEIVADIDEHSCEHKHCSHVHRNHSLKEEFLEVVGRMADEIENDSWCKNS